MKDPSPLQFNQTNVPALQFILCNTLGTQQQIYFIIYQFVEKENLFLQGSF